MTDSTASSVKPHTHCRVCGNGDLVIYCGLGDQPLANELLPLNFCGTEFTAPLEVAHCRKCGLSQLTVVVSPDRLYADYPFRSGANPAWVKHCEALQREIGTPGFVVDIGANDGAQLAAFRHQGSRTLGIDPSAVGKDIISTYWSVSLAREIADTYGMADCIIVQNVLGHVDRIHDFLHGVRALLSSEGVFVLEVPDMLDGLVPAHAFDTIYHEHLSYWSEAPLTHALAQHDLKLISSQKLAVHGGSKRYWIRHGTEEPQTYTPPPVSAYDQHRTDVNAFLRSVHAKLQGISAAKKTLWAYGASAKGTVMLNALKNAGNGIWPDFIVDDEPRKQGRRVPGVRIPIVPPQDLSKVKALWILSWNWQQQLEARAKELGFHGVVI